MALMLIEFAVGLPKIILQLWAELWQIKLEDETHISNVFRCFWNDFMSFRQ